jgi:hypothetical protein
MSFNRMKQQNDNQQKNIQENDINWNTVI